MAPPCSVTTTEETGRHVTPERIRADVVMMEREGFELAYECPMSRIRALVAIRRLGDPACDNSLEDYLRSTNDIPGQPGRFA